MEKIKKLYLNTAESIKNYARSVQYCIMLSFSASVFYTVTRLLITAVIPSFSIFSAYILKEIIDMLSMGRERLMTPLPIFYLCGILIAIRVVSLLLQKINSYIEELHNEQVQNTIRLNVMEKGLKSDISLFDDVKAYNHFFSIITDSYAINNVLWTLINSVSALVSFVGAFLILSKISLVYCVILIITSLPAAVIKNIYMQREYQLALSRVGEQRKIDYIFQISILKQYAQPLRLYGANKYFVEKYQKIWKTMFKEKKALKKKQSIMTCVLEIMPEVVFVFILIEIVAKAFYGITSIGDVSLYIAMISQLIVSISSFVGSVVIISENQLKIKNIQSFDKLVPIIDDKGKISLKRVKKIEFVNVSFEYPNEHGKFALKDISFQIEANQKLGIVGVNGAGKSTLIKLLLRFYDVTKGKILINDVDIKEYTIRSLRKNFAVYFQNEANYAFSLKDNLTLGDIERNDDQGLWNALDQAGAKELVNGFTDKMDTYLSRMYDENGVELSGGQLQKIALARAFYRRASFTILDEPSSALDPEAENKLFLKLEELCKEKAAIVTSHRLSNTTLMDRIIVIENGEIIESGTLEELLKMKGRFSKLFHYQADKYSAGFYD